jgi:hypothetical protein
VAASAVYVVPQVSGELRYPRNTAGIIKTSDPITVQTLKIMNEKDNRGFGRGFELNIVRAPPKKASRYRKHRSAAMVQPPAAALMAASLLE